MRRALLLVAAAALAAVAAGCGGGGNKQSSGTTTRAGSCAKSDLHLVHSGQLTIGTGNPAYPPWYEGGTRKGSSFEVDDPATGQGYESAVAYAIANRLGFSHDEVKWIAVPFNQTFKPGPKNFDFAMQQISYSTQRAKAVDFSNSYYDVNQALVAVKDSSIANATSITDLKDAKLGAVVGTTSYGYIVDTIKSSHKPSVYDTLNDNVAALKNGQIDGLVTDFPTAYYIANVQLSNAKLVGRFPSGATQEYFGLTFQKDNPLVDCVNKAILALRQNGTLSRIEQRWITSKAHAPLIKQ